MPPSSAYGTRLQGAAEPAIEDYRWLVSGDADPWIRQAAAENGSLVTRIKTLRAALGSARAHLVLQQIELRRNAGEKFVAAEQMFFTRRALEQATDQRIAAYKAGRFPTDVLLYDLCCGLGGDLMALASRGRALGVERDPVLALLAESNCRRLGLLQPKVHLADVRDVRLEDNSVWHIDPDRRCNGRRTTHLNCSEPGLDVLCGLLRQSSDAAIKLAPAAGLPTQWQDIAEREWIGHRGECKQQVAWFGRLARRGGLRTATVLDHFDNSPRTVVGQANLPVPVHSPVRRYVFEPHAAVLAAGLAGTLAAEHRLVQLSSSAVYLSGDRPVFDPALAAFEVTDVLPFDGKCLKRLLRERCIGRLEVKKSGTNHDPRQVRRQLHPHGENSATLLLTRIEKRVIAILAKRQCEHQTTPP